MEKVSGKGGGEERKRRYWGRWERREGGCIKVGGGEEGKAREGNVDGCYSFNVKTVCHSNSHFLFLVLSLSLFFAESTRFTSWIYFHLY